MTLNNISKHPLTLSTLMHLIALLFISSTIIGIKQTPTIQHKIPINSYLYQKPPTEKTVIKESANLAISKKTVVLPQQAPVTNKQQALINKNITEQISKDKPLKTNIKKMM